MIQFQPRAMPCNTCLCFMMHKMAAESQLSDTSKHSGKLEALPCCQEMPRTPPQPTSYCGMGVCGVMSIRGSAIRPDWLARILELRGMAVAWSLISQKTSTRSRLGCTRSTLPTGTPLIWYPNTDTSDLTNCQILHAGGGGKQTSASKQEVECLQTCEKLASAVGEMTAAHSKTRAGMPLASEHEQLISMRTQVVAA